MGFSQVKDEARVTGEAMSKDWFVGQPGMGQEVESAEVGLERQGCLPSRLSPRGKASTRQSAGWSGSSEVSWKLLNPSP